MQTLLLSIFISLHWTHKLRSEFSFTMQTIYLVLQQALAFMHLEESASSFFLTNPAAINTYLLEQWVLLSCIKKWDLPGLCAKWNLEVSFQQRGKVSV